MSCNEAGSYLEVKMGNTGILDEGAKCEGQVLGNDTR